LTFFYHGGQDKYQAEQTLAPAEQMWLDLGRLIRDQVLGRVAHAFDSIHK
jgi:hypothetical protein